MDSSKEIEKMIQEVNGCDHEYRCMYRHTTSDMRCTKCGKVITHDEYKSYTSGKVVDDLQNKIDSLTKELYIIKNPSSLFSGATGWICPVCGRGNAPTTPTCSCKSLFGTRISYSTGAKPLTTHNSTVGIVGGDIG